MNTEKEFKSFVENYSPFPWELNPEEIREIFSGQHTFEIGYKRFFHVYKYLKEINKKISNPKIIDVGSFPGNMIKLCKYAFGSYSKYYSLGLDIDTDFISEVSKYNVECLDTEIDPQFPGAKNPKNWNLSNLDVCLLLDTIEHLVNPTYCLDKINNSLKSNGYLLITTDNISNFFYILKMIIRGESPNVNFILSSKFYIGNNRPHHREYSKSELKFLLEYSGFEILEHEFFDREQGDYHIKNKKIIRKRKKLNYKGFISEKIKSLVNVVPHLRNHQVVLARKKSNLEDLNRFQPTHSKEKWLEYRLKTLGY